MIYGVNALQNQSNWALLPAWMERLRPGWTVVQDEYKLALELRQRGWNVIYRAKRDDDSRMHETLTPAEFVAWHHAEAPDKALVIQCLNEPVVTNEPEVQRLVDWLVEVMALATRQQMRLCVGNFAVGNPHELAIVTGHFDRLIAACIDGNHILGLHEYALRGEIAERYHIGRYRWWLERDARLKIVITETGFDIGGGAGDGWRAHLTAQQYADLLWKMAKIYHRDRVSACVYGWGRGFGWDKFDIEGESIIMSTLESINAEAQAVQAPRPALAVGQRVRITPAAAGTNVRRAAAVTSPLLLKLTGATTTTINAVTAAADGRNWYRVLIGDVEGWIREDAAAWKVIAEEPQPDPDGVYITLPEFKLSKVELLALADVLSALAEGIRKGVQDA